MPQGLFTNDVRRLPQKQIRVLISCVSLTVGGVTKYKYFEDVIFEWSLRTSKPCVGECSNSSIVCKQLLTGQSDVWDSIQLNFNRMFNRVFNRVHYTL